MEYLSRYLLFMIPILLMNNFTLYMIASEKAALSLVYSVAGGVSNMVLDYVLIAVFDMGISGAAAVTIIMYVLMFASSLYTGYSYGVAPMLILPLVFGVNGIWLATPVAELMALALSAILLWMTREIWVLTTGGLNSFHIEAYSISQQQVNISQQSNCFGVSDRL